MDEIESLVAQLYKSDSAKLLAVLIRLFGSHNFDLAEDVVQETFSKALLLWRKNGVVANPAAWLMQTAKNQAIDSLRKNKTLTNFADDLTHVLTSEWTLGSTVENEFDEEKIKDDQLKMIFICCHDSISIENRLPFILKTLCGFSIPAVARALLLPISTVKKRLLRSKEKFKQLAFELPKGDDLNTALVSVHTVLYLLFNEGFHSSDNKQPINDIFCFEAHGLVKLLLAEPEIADQETLSLSALMYFHLARINSRIDQVGNTIPLDLQNRSLWRKPYIEQGDELLQLADAIVITNKMRFYYEAKIAQQHCHANQFNQTDWLKIIDYYRYLVEVTASPVAQLNQAIAIAYAGDCHLAISQVELLQQDKTFKTSYIPAATLAHLFAKLGNKNKALSWAKQAKEIGGTAYEHRLMMEQITRLLAIYWL